MGVTNEWHINDLSVSGQYRSPQDFRDALEPLLKLRHRRKFLKDNLFCSRLFVTRLATSVLTVQQATIALRDGNYTRLVLTWLANSGPLWDDERFPNPDDYFHFEGADVTDQGLGEAARRRLVLIEAGVFSFPHGTMRFRVTPLLVGHGLPEDPIDEVSVPNVWSLEELEHLTSPNP
jgi:hypothetical protein